MYKLLQISKAMDGEALLTIHTPTLNRTDISLQCAANGQPNWLRF